MVCANIRGGPDVVLTPAQIQAAMDTVGRPMPYTPWWAISTLRPSPRKPSSTGIVRASEPVSRDIVADPIPDVPAVSEPPTAAEMFGGISMRLDISVWRLPHLWRLVVSFVARRLGR